MNKGYDYCTWDFVFFNAEELVFEIKDFLDNDPILTGVVTQSLLPIPSCPRLLIPHP